MGTGAVSLPSWMAQRLLGAEPIQVTLAPGQWTTIFQETFESPSWPTSGWWVRDRDGATNGEYYWANRCPGRNSARSAWAVGGGANGTSLACGANYPNLVDSWMIYGPVDLSNATEARLEFDFWVNSECEGTNCATKSDRLWILASSDGSTFTGGWRAGAWIQNPSADANGWVSGSYLNLSSWLGQPQVWVAFLFLRNYLRSLVLQYNYVWTLTTGGQ